MKRISLILVLLCSNQAGCFMPMINFDPPPYKAIGHEALPAKVELAFQRMFPDTLIQQVEVLTWPPTGDEHYRLTFENGDDVMRVRFNQHGKKLGEPTVANETHHPNKHD